MEVAPRPSWTGTATDLTLNVSVPSLSNLRVGAFLRYTNTSNWLMAVYEPKAIDNLIRNISLCKRVAGTVTNIGTFETALPLGWRTLRVVATTAGLVTVYDAATGATPTSVLSLVDSALAAGGSLESGGYGIYDAYTGPSVAARLFDNIAVATATVQDAAVFASRSAEVRSDRMQREDSRGTLWVPRYDYKGSYFRPPPARREARTIRTIVKLARGNIDTMADSAIDDASFKIFWQARGLALPES